VRRGWCYGKYFDPREINWEEDVAEGNILDPRERK